MSKKTYEVLSNLTSYQANAIQNLTVALIQKKKEKELLMPVVSEGP